MAHLLRQMYVDEIDFEAVTIEKNSRPGFHGDDS